MTPQISQEMNMESRTGRDNQRYGGQGERLVAGVVPLSADKTKVMIIGSTRRSGWVLPKGGWELDEPTASAAASREAWEEAGVICSIEADLGEILDTRSPKNQTENAPKCQYQFFEGIVKEERSEWPDMYKRTRQWVGYAQAVHALTDRPELLEALKRSSLQKG